MRGNCFYLKNAEAFNGGKIKDTSQVGVTALDPFTVQSAIEPSDPCFPRRLRDAAGERGSRGSHRKNERRVDQNKATPGQRPLRTRFLAAQRQVRLRKNPRYWDAANTQSKIIDLLPIGSASSALKPV